MRKVISLTMILASMALSSNVSAENYFFSMNGKGEMDGTNWDNSAPAEYLASTLENAQPNDCFYLTAGKYINVSGIVWNIPQGITIKGGYPADSKGSDVTITYPTKEETIFSADIDGDGKGDNGSTVFMSFNNNNTDPDMSNYAKTTISGIVIRDAASVGKDYRGTAVYANNANLEFDHVKIINNKSENKGGATAFIGTTLYAHDCIWADNTGLGSGLAMVIRQKGSGTTSGKQGSNVIIERCEFTNNISISPDNSSKATYGGAIALADYGGVLYMINSTVTGSHISWAGAMARISGGCTFYGIGNTWFNCTCNYSSRHSGDILSCGSGSKVYVASSIAVTPTDGRDGMMATNLVQGGSGAVFEPYGYNVWGSLNDALAVSLSATNDIDKNNNQTTVFGTNEYGNHGGFSQTIAPKAEYCKVPLSEILSLASKWNLPASIDLSLDQRGFKRQSTTYVGAYDVNAVATSAETIRAEKKSFAIIGLGNGQYQLSDNVKGEVSVYNLTGNCVYSQTIQAAETINLSDLAEGIYILSVNGQAQKFIK